MQSIFKARKKYPFHLSIGAVVVNEKGEICCHHYPQGLPYENNNEGELYLLMRETPEEGESIENAVHRGIKEEFGIEGEVKHFLGAINSWFPGVTTGIPIYKTTLYFLVEMESMDLRERDYSDVEQQSEVVWVEPAELMRRFSDQGKRFERTDLDESKIIENYLSLLKL